MTQTFSGWTVGLKDKDGRTSFLGVRTTAEGTKYGTLCDTPLEENVYSNLFDTQEGAMAFWKSCCWEYLTSKDSLAALPVKISISLDVACLGFEWSGIAV